MRHTYADLGVRTGRIQRARRATCICWQLPIVAFSRLVSSQRVSSGKLLQEFPATTQHYRQANRIWPGSYFVGSVGGAPISALRQQSGPRGRRPTYMLRQASLSPRLASRAGSAPDPRSPSWRLPDR